MPKLPKHFTYSLQKVVESLHGRSIQSNFAKEWSIKEEEATSLLQYLFDTGMITIRWSPEKHTLCFIEKELLN